MSKIISFDIKLPIEYEDKIKHLKDKSYYDHNYYELPTYGDWLDFGKDNNNILYEEYHECENCYFYCFGRFEDDKFVRALGYTTDRDILHNFDIE